MTEATTAGPSATGPAAAERPPGAAPVAGRNRHLDLLAADPRAYFAEAWRDGPVDTRRVQPGGLAVTRRAEIEEVLKDPRRFSSHVPGLNASVRPMIPLNIDPPDHVKYRRLLDPLFSPRRMATLEPEVASLTNSLIDAFADRGSCDLSQDLSVPLPSQVFLTLLGLPLDGLPEFLRMKDDIVRPGGGTDEERRAVVTRAATESYTLFADTLTERMREPRDDLLTLFVNSEVDGHRLSFEECLDICFLLLTAGLDTVSISLQCIFHHLATHDAARRLIVDDPATVPAVVEELLRWESPVTQVIRRAAVDTEIAGHPVAAGTLVSVLLAGANIDDRDDPTAGEVEFDRRVNRHLAFGGGIHRCLGSHLARMELRVAVAEWHKRVPDYALAPGTSVEWNGSALRGIDHLPLVWPAP